MLTNALPTITVADLHAGTHRYTLVFDSAATRVNERYIRLYHYRPGEDTRIISLPTAIALLLSYAKKSYGLHPCSPTGECAKREPSEAFTLTDAHQAHANASKLLTEAVTRCIANRVNPADDDAATHWREALDKIEARYPELRPSYRDDDETQPEPIINPIEPVFAF